VETLQTAPRANATAPQLHAAPEAVERGPTARDMVSARYLQEHGETLHIVHLAVAPGQRGAGRGSRLVRRVLRHADSARLSAYAEVSTLVSCFKQLEATMAVQDELLPHDCAGAMKHQIRSRHASCAVRTLQMYGNCMYMPSLRSNVTIAAMHFAAHHHGKPC
jgi:predicted GNAT family acetyltransferase